MTRPKTLPKWQSELKAALKVACGLGWSVSDDRGRAQLSVSRDGKRSKLSLAPLEFEAGNQAAIVDFVSQLFRLVETGDHSLETAKAVLTGQQAQATVTATGTNWIELKDQFKEFKLTNGTQISAKTWKLYERYLSEAVALLCKPSAPVKAFELIDRTVKSLGLTNKHRARKQCVEYTLQFLQWGMAHAGLPGCWALPAGQKKQLVGTAPAKQLKATLNDQTLLLLIESCPTSEWSNVLTVMAAFGLRPEELFYLSVLVNPASGREQFFCSYEKISGVHKTKKRWLAEVPLKDADGAIVDLNLIERWKSGNLQFPPMSDRGGALSQYLRRLPMWQQLRADLGAEGKILRPYVFRDSYAVRGHLAQVPSTVMCDLMGHSLQTHDQHYVTSSEETNAQVLETLFQKS